MLNNNVTTPRKSGHFSTGLLPFHFSPFRHIQTHIHTIHGGGGGGGGGVGDVVVVNIERRYLGITCRVA